MGWYIGLGLNRHSFRSYNGNQPTIDNNDNLSDPNLTNVTNSGNQRIGRADIEVGLSRFIIGPLYASAGGGVGFREVRNSIMYTPDMGEMTNVWAENTDFSKINYFGSIGVLADIGPFVFSYHLKSYDIKFNNFIHRIGVGISSQIIH